MFAKQYNRPRAQLAQFLGKRVEQLSRITGFVQRKRKLDGVSFVRALVLSWLERPSASLNEVRHSLAEMGVDISESALQQRLNNKAVALLKGLFEEALAALPKARRVPAQVLRHFSAVYVLDSTTVTLPARLSGLFAGCGGNASGAAVKIRLSVDYLTGSLAACEVVAGRSADQTCQQHVASAQVGSLHLFDLGFFKVGVFEALAAAQAYFISRLLPHTGLYQLDGAQAAFDLNRAVSHTPDNLLELDLALGQRSRLPVRLIAHKLPEAVAAQRRRQAKRKASRHGQTCSGQHLALLDWSVFITNIPRAWLSAQQVMLVYRVRWQVELLFKLCKSQAQLDEVGQCGPQRFLCQLYARLLGVLVCEWMLLDVPFDPSVELSLPKAFAILQRYAARLRAALCGHSTSLLALLQKLNQALRRFALKQKRRKHPSTLARLLAAQA